MSVERDPVAKARNALDNKLGPDQYRPPERWTMTSSWKRAQLAPAKLRPVGAAEWIMQLGYVDHDGYGDRHRVLFTIRDRDLLADCDCAAHRHRGWCAHLATMWWRWTQSNLDVYNLDTASVHVSPPWWLDVPGGDPL